jgi:phage tail sheath protein FI
MAGIPTSPAVVFLEKDNSAYPPNIDSSIVGIVGYATRGPEDVATLITSQENLIRVFGKPLETLPGQGLEGALEILETTNQVRFVRAAPSDATQASASMRFGVCPAVQFAPSGFGVTTPLYLKVTAKDADGVVVLENKKFTIPSGTLVSIGQASAIAAKVGDGSVATDHVFVSFDENTKTTGYLATTYAGIYSELWVTAYSNDALTTPMASALAPLSLSSGNALGYYVSSIMLSGLDISSASFSYNIKSLYKGTGYNLTTDSNTGETLGVSVESDNGGGTKTFINVNNDGVVAETYRVSLQNDPTFVETVININSDNAVSDYIQAELAYAGVALGTVSKLASPHTKVTQLQPVEMSAGVTVTLANGNFTASATPRFVKFVDTTLNLSGGTNGTDTTYSALIGNAAEKTGIYALDDDLLNISMGIVPGIYDQDVQNNLITLAETSQNFLAAISPPEAVGGVEDAIDWMNGKGDGRTAAINSSWVAVFWPWVQVFDVFSAKDMWYDPAIFAIRQMAFTDNVAETWFAPAGFRRGRLTKPTAVEYPLNQGDRDALYVSNLNPIVNFVPEGITIFGQKTAQRAATALDRINVRRLMIFLRKVLLQTGRQDLFEPNDAFTWEIIKDKAEAVLTDIQSRRGITDFRVICDETVNTPVRVDRNELWCKILLKPTKTAEWIIFEVNLTSQSAKFSG